MNNRGLKCIHIFKSGLQNDFELLRILNYWCLNNGGSTVFSFQDDNLVKCHSILTKLCMCIDIMEICFGIANGQILSIFDSYLPAVNSGRVLFFFHVFVLFLSVSVTEKNFSLS